MVRVVTLSCVEAVPVAGCSFVGTASGFESFLEDLLVLDVRKFLSAFCFAFDDSTGGLCAATVFDFDDRVTRLLGSSADAGSDVLRRFGAMFVAHYVSL
jgi:hypothetical protein